jgi:peptide-methionine (R)-S-oxide reductase
MFSTRLENAGHMLRDRRAFFGICAAGVAAGFGWLYGEFLPEESDIAPPGPPKMVSVVDFSDSGAREGIRTVPQILKSDREWRRHLTYTSFVITRKGGTELPYTGTYWTLHDKGLYRCICCGTALFSTDTKFDSGTGWPSFWAPIAEENISTAEDHTLKTPRIAISCRRCDAHLGHVFTDGPEPTGLRYCLNSASLNFVKSSQKPAI